jgi:enoyl-CoA hydratase/carnithine racemase
MVTVIPGEIGVLRLDRPQRANAYDPEMIAALEAGATALAASRVVIVETSGDGAFCAGADRDALASATAISALDLAADRAFQALATAPFVTIAAVHGAAVGGGFELALACDLRIAAPSARFWLPETSLGLVPAAGGCRRLAAMVGTARARSVILGGRALDAATAEAWGIVDEVHPDPRAHARLRATALSARDPLAQRLARAIIDEEGASWLGRVSEGWLYQRRAATPG